MKYNGVFTNKLLTPHFNCYFYPWYFIYKAYAYIYVLQLCTILLISAVFNWYFIILNRNHAHFFNVCLLVCVFMYSFVRSFIAGCYIFCVNLCDFIRWLLSTLHTHMYTHAVMLMAWFMYCKDAMFVSDVVVFRFLCYLNISKYDQEKIMHVCVSGCLNAPSFIENFLSCHMTQ